MCECVRVHMLVNGQGEEEGGEEEEEEGEEGNVQHTEAPLTQVRPQPHRRGQSFESLIQTLLIQT